jgi:hypothetical protein
VSSGVRPAEVERAQLQELETQLTAARAAREVNHTIVRVMTGKHPAIHDRFLIVDDRAWLLGSSLGAFGERGSMLVELPFPTQVLPELERVWLSESTSIAERLNYLVDAQGTT